MTNEMKYKKLFNFFGRWVSLNEDGFTVGSYLKARGINKIAVYGLGQLGRHLLHELKSSGLHVEYGIDKRSSDLNLDVNFVDLERDKSLPQVDILIVTAITDYDEIEKEICQQYEYPIISLEEIIIAMEEQRRKSEA